jgi:uncharacterized protein
MTPNRLPGPYQNEVPVDDLLTPQEQDFLLQIARKAIISCVTRTDEEPPGVPEGRLQEKRGCFVCIKIHGMLRGCIGAFESEKPLHQLVRDMAESSACRDPRFYPLKKLDLDDFQVEISALTPMRKIESPEEVEVGMHGIYIEKNSFRGVLLPQVATEHGWDRETFLSQTCVKAGLRKEDWKEGADIFVFSAQVFSDKQKNA